RLVSDEVLDLARREARRIDVGKRPGRHGYRQGEIDALLVDLARAGHRVVRLKGGDPFIFGRGGEELEHLSRHGVPCEVVPGITAASAAAAATGVPLTHRGVAGAVTLLTGHAADGLPEHDWERLATGGQTLALYMGVGHAAPIAERLIAGGLPAATPVMVVENASTPRQRAVQGRLAGLADLLAEHAIKAPALVLIGEVAGLALGAEAGDGADRLALAV
ncbi:MAG TPA: uroporphyrinogen-III C-methyltransferase, partial [Alphaproteobacteria bacterium]|nr:uroporphyrinogen-III C-methyltransferase [Alphaproteobacteria bacterium]